MAEDHEDAAFPKPDRGAPIVATLPRWLTLALFEAALVFGLAYAYLSFVHPRDTTLETLLPWLVFGAASLALITFVILRAEESRVTRELRVARSGTPVIRGLVAQRRQKAPFFLRYLSTSIGTAAVLLADGDKNGAAATLDQSSPLMRGGGLTRLRAIVQADLDRARGAVDGAIAELRAMPPLGHREADRYRTHVLVKAILQKGDAEIAEEVLAQVEKSADEEERLYAVWLSAWYAPEDDEAAQDERFTEPELRLASLLARSQGADDLVKKLEARIARFPQADGTSPAPPGPGR